LLSGLRLCPLQLIFLIVDLAEPADKPHCSSFFSAHRRHTTTFVSSDVSVTPISLLLHRTNLVLDQRRASILATRLIIVVIGVLIFKLVA
jgi:hypothetical protein